MIYRFLQSGRLTGALWLFVIIVTVVSVQQLIFREEVAPNITTSPVFILAIPLVAAGILLNRRGMLIVAIILIATVIVAPMTTRGRNYPTRISCEVQEKSGQVVLDQLRTVDKTRLTKRLGSLTNDEQRAVLQALAELFAE